MKALFKLLTLITVCIFTLRIGWVYAGNETAKSDNPGTMQSYTNGAFGYFFQYPSDYKLYQFTDQIELHNEEYSPGDPQVVTVRIELNNPDIKAETAAKKYLPPIQNLKIIDSQNSNFLGYKSFLVRFKADALLGEIYVIPVADLNYIINFYWQSTDPINADNKGINGLLLPAISFTPENKKNNLYYDNIEGYYYFAPNTWQRNTGDNSVQTLTQSKNVYKMNIIGIAYFGKQDGFDSLDTKARWFSDRYRKLGYQQLEDKSYQEGGRDYYYYSWSMDNTKIITILTLRQSKYYLIEAIIRDDSLIPQIEEILSSIKFGQFNVN